MKRSSLTRFSGRAKAYARCRPQYPPEAIDAALDGLGDPSTLAIADVGAGTGISSRLFADRGARVIALEPNAEMRAAAEPHARVEWREGTADRSGLSDRSVDLAVACQAFHWFATPQVMHEFRRIARRAAMLQYERDERHAFTKAYGEIVRAYAQDDTEALRLRALETFAAFPDARVMRSTFTSRQPLDAQGVIGRAASSSYLPQSGAEAAALHAELHRAFERHRGADGVELATITFVLVADF